MPLTFAGEALGVLFVAQLVEQPLRAFLLGYGKPEAELHDGYAERLLAFSLSHRFANLERLLAAAAPHSPKSMRELARLLYPLGAA